MGKWKERTAGGKAWAWAYVDTGGAVLGSVMARGRYRVSYRAATAAGGKVGRPGQDAATLEAAKRQVLDALGVTDG
jgi:hypothetical protein